MVQIHLYWSDHCPYSLDLIQLLDLTGLKYYAHRDIPHNIERVPTLVMYNIDQRRVGILTGRDAFEYINKYIKRKTKVYWIDKITLQD